MDKPVYFISDLHLGAKYYNSPIEHERRVVAWLDSIKDRASALYLLGDILDYWYEYRYVVPRGYTRFFGKIAELSDSGVEVFWFIGNHDIWIFDYLPSELGVKVLDGSAVKAIMGKKFFLSHGDGVGHKTLSFRLIRSVFRNKAAQFMFSAIHPRWTVPFAHNWSSHSRKSHTEIEKLKAAGTESLRAFSKEYLSEKEHIDYFVYGHVHCVVNENIGTNSRLVILGDWIDLFSYGVFDGKELRIEYYKSNK